MLREFLSAKALALGPVVALTIFSIFMLGVLAWVLRPGSGALYRHLGRGALDD